MKAKESWIWGLHSVEALLQNYPELCAELILEPFKGGLDPEHKKLLSLAKECGLKFNAAAIPRSLQENRHQGVAARIKNFPLQIFPDFAQENSDLSGVWVLLDRVQDPRNYGAILRSAAAFGVKGVFVSDKEQSPLTGVVAQASAGNLFRLPIIEAINLNRVTDLFVEAQAQMVGLDMEGVELDYFCKKLGPSDPVLWMLGSEGRGLRDGLAKRCTTMVKIPMAAAVESLNVSAAASIAFYATRKL